MNSRLCLSLLAGAALAFPAMAQSRFDRHQALRTCKNEIRQQAMEEFGASRVTFPVVSLNNNAGGNDWITGTVRIGHGPNAQVNQFSCSADFNTGAVRSAQLRGMPPTAYNQAQPNNYWGPPTNSAVNNQPMYMNPPAHTTAVSNPPTYMNPPAAQMPCNCGNQVMNTQPVVNPQPVINNQSWGEASRDVDSIAIENCQAAASRRIRKDGYGAVRFQSTNIAEQPNGNHVWGNARGKGWYQAKRFGYSCSVDSNGYVQNSNVSLGR